MPFFEYGDVKIEVDEDGFIQEPESWNEEVAKLQLQLKMQMK